MSKLEYHFHFNVENGYLLKLLVETNILSKEISKDKIKYVLISLFTNNPGGWIIAVHRTRRP